jgi:hypothetical protein
MTSIFNPTPPSQRLRDDLAGLEGWARMCPPHFDEGDWSPATYAQRIQSELAGIDQDFARMLREVEKARKGEP